MRDTMIWRRAMTVATAVGITVLALSAPAVAATPSVSVVSTSVNGSVVSVVVRNNTASVQTHTVGVQATVGGSSVWSFVPVTLLPSQTATVCAGFLSVVSTVAKVGIADDGVPF
jgi:hypothetical protein